MATYGATNNDKVGIKVSVRFQWCFFAQVCDWIICTCHNQLQWGNHMFSPVPQNVSIILELHCTVLDSMAVCQVYLLKIMENHWIYRYRQTSNIRRIKSQNLSVSRFVLRLSLPNPLKPGVKSQIENETVVEATALLQIHLSDQQFYCLLTRVLY